MIRTISIKQAERRIYFPPKPFFPKNPRCKIHRNNEIPLYDMRIDTEKINLILGELLGRLIPKETAIKYVGTFPFHLFDKRLKAMQEAGLILIAPRKKHLIIII